MPAAAWLLNLGFAGSVSAVGGPTIATTTLDDAIGGDRYSAILAATGGTEPLTWTISAGSLPDGLNLSPGGVINGTPTRIDVFTFTVQVEDANSNTDTQELSLTILDPGVSGVWERIPLIFGLRVRDVTAPVDQARMSVAVPLAVADTTRMVETVRLKVGRAVAMGRAADSCVLTSASKAQAGVLKESTLEDIQVLLWTGILTAEEGLALTLEYLREE